MPKYLRDYQTEFHYLFHQIYRCKDSQGAHENHEVFYNFGNNLRKFLEAYLFYKYPYKDDQAGSSERLLQFFGEDATATALANRVGNESEADRLPTAADYGPLNGSPSERKGSRLLPTPLYTQQNDFSLG